MEIFPKEGRHYNDKIYNLEAYKKQGDKTRCDDSKKTSFATFRSCRSQAAVDGDLFFAWTKEGYNGRQDPARVGQVGSCDRYSSCAKKVTGTTWDWKLYKNTFCANKLGDDKCNKLAASDMCDVMAEDCEKACKVCSSDGDAETVYMTTKHTTEHHLITYVLAGIGIVAVGYGAFKHFSK